MTLESEHERFSKKLFHYFEKLTEVQVLFATHKLGLFKTVGLSNVSIVELGEKLAIHERPLKQCLFALESMGFIDISSGQVSLTELCKSTLLPESENYFGDSIDLFLAHPRVTTVTGLLDAIQSNSPQTEYSLFDGKQGNQQDDLLFARAMKNKSRHLAKKWIEALAIESDNVFVDVGGGVGVHALAAKKRFNLEKAIVYDLASTISHIEEDIPDCLEVQSGDFFSSSLPCADVHFFCDIFHDWSDNQVCEVMRNSYSTVRSGGRLIICEMLLKEDERNGLSESLFSVNMLLWTHGRQRSYLEYKRMLTESGFIKIELVKIGGSLYKLIVAHTGRC